MELILRTERDTRKFRLLALLVAVAGMYLRQNRVDIWPAVYLAAAYLVYLTFFGPLVLPRVHSPSIVYGMTVVDAVALTVALRIAGGLDSALFILLPLFIIYYSIYLGYASSLFAATVFSLGYVGVYLWLGHQASAGPIIAVQVPFLYLLAVFSGHLAGRRLQERKEKEELQELIRLEKGAKSLIEVARGLTQSLKLGEALTEVANTAPSLLGFNHSLVALMEDNDRLRARASTLEPARLGVERIEQMVTKLGDDKLSASALEQRLPMAFGASAEGPLPEWASKLEVKSLLAVPLASGKQKLGVLYLLNTDDQRNIVQADLDMARGYGELVAGTLANALAYQQTQSKVGQLVNDMEGVIQRLERLRLPAHKRELVVGNLSIDGARGKVTLNNSPLSLSPTEFEVLYALAENAGHPVNQETLLRRVWGEDFSGHTNVVDVSVHRLRRKLEKVSTRDHIPTIRGMGYMLTDSSASPLAKG